MTGSFKEPRIFISYARSDGEDFARALRMRLEVEGISLWQDRVGMEGGRDWWLQIIEALNHIEFMVLVMTPAAMQSVMVRKECGYARQQGVCVYPVQGNPNLDFSSLPRWMRDAHFYDLDHEWTKFVNDLNTRCQVPRVPFMVEDLPVDFVPRPNEFKELIGKLLDEQREEPIAITAALRGAGGYGKTTMAKALCHDERIQQAFDDGILWVTLGEDPGNLVGKVEDLIYILSKERPGFTGIDAATARLAELLADRDILLVIDDVWNAAHLKPFQQGGKRSARLITTRDDRVLPPEAQSIRVAAMQQDEAVQLLSVGLHDIRLSSGDLKALYILSSTLGEWALLLTLVNGVLRERVNTYHQSLLKALAYINTALEKRGLTVFDANNVQDRSQAVAKTLGVSFGLLNSNEYARYRELAVFPKAVDIPLAALQRLWGATGGLDDFDTEALCERFHGLSLLLNFDMTVRQVRLHDIVHAYLRREVGEGLATLHGQLLDAYELKRWAEISSDEPYLWDHLAEHLVSAGRVESLVATVKDVGYLTKKTRICSIYATEADLAMAESAAPADTSLRVLKRSFVSVDYLLNRCETLYDFAAVLHSRLVHQDELSDLCHALEQELPRPFLTSWRPLPDLPHPALIRTLQGHTGSVTGCAISPTGDYVVSTSEDGTLKVWDASTGQQRLTLRGHIGPVTGCAINSTGDVIVSASRDNTLKVWDAHTGEERLTLGGHTGPVNGCAVSPIGDVIVSASSDKTLKVWDMHTGTQRLTLQGHIRPVLSCAINPAGDMIVSAAAEHTLKVWDAHTGEERLTLRGHGGYVWSCTVSPVGDVIVSASDDGGLKVWDAHSGEERLTLQDETGPVQGCAVSPEGDIIVSASCSGTLKVWDAHTGEERLNLQGHTGPVNGCAVSSLSGMIVSASWDRTLKLWDIYMKEVRVASQGYTSWVHGCAISQAGDVAVSASHNNTLKVWDVHTGEERLILQGHGSWVSGCAVDPVGDVIVSASRDGSLKVWDAHTGEERLTLRGHTGPVTGCAISPTGDYIVSTSDDETLKVWDVHRRKERLTLWGHRGSVNGCAISPMGDVIVSASDDGTLKVWDARTGEERQTLQGHTAEVARVLSAQWGM
jgi:WD40 repeat protein